MAKAKKKIVRAKVWLRCTFKEKLARWENARRVLRELTPHQRQKHWDMQVWGVEEDCGTIACAAGHCGMDPWFQRRGFTLKPASAHDVMGLDGMERIGSGEFVRSVVPHDFFGFGSRNIFYNIKRRPVGEVIKEITAYIKALKRNKGIDPREDWS